MKPGWILLAFLPAAAPHVPQFEDIAERAGLTQVFPNGGTASKQYIIETTGSGVAFLDYDNDGLIDIFVASGDGGPSRLYHNDGHDRFRDVSQSMGINKVGWAQGVCAGDYDNDGYVDLFVTYWGQNTLYHNEAGKRFRDVTAQAGLTQDRTRYNTGCAFIDYDRDGRVDLFIANYLKFSFEETPKPGANPYCWYMQMPVNCGPRGLPFDRNILYHANGDGTFTDVSIKSGIAEPGQSYCLTALTGDFDNDGWPDIFVACDQTPSLLYMNQHDGTFREEALLRGAALNEDGKALSGMGAAAADYAHTGWLGIFRTNFSDERETLYRNNGHAEFEDATQASGSIGRNTRFVGWGCAFFDFDNDAWRDLVLVNGHVFPEVDRKQTDVRYKDRRILYRNLQGKFDDISEQAGTGIVARHSSRGLATGDIDNDGTLELLINNQGERPSLLKQTSKAPGNWIILDLEGTRSNRRAIGARVQLTASGITQIDEVRSGGSYLSQNDLRLHFGLANARAIDSIDIQWPGGAHQILKDLPCCRVAKIVEPPVKK
jgi:hypothetical protein